MRKITSFFLLLISVGLGFASPIFIASSLYSYLGFGMLALAVILFFAAIMGWHTGTNLPIKPPKE